MSEFEPLPDADAFPDQADEFPPAPDDRGPVAVSEPPQAPSQTLQMGEEPSEAMSPITGEVIQLADPVAVAAALDEARLFKREKLDPYINGLERVVAVMSRTVGSGTIRAGEYELVVSKKRTYTRDLPAIHRDLLAAGLPSDRCSEVIKQTVSWSADTRDLDRLAKANPEYKAIIDRHTEVTEKDSTTKVTRARQAGG